VFWALTAAGICCCIFGFPVCVSKTIRKTRTMNPHKTPMETLIQIFELLRDFFL